MEVVPALLLLLLLLLSFATSLWCCFQNDQYCMCNCR